MNLKENINKIHYNLQESFGDVEIKEKTDKKTGKYFEISSIQENKKLLMRINFTDLENSRFKWFYSENPLNEESNWIERNSLVDSIHQDIKDIFEKNRFCDEYLKTIKK